MLNNLIFAVTAGLFDNFTQNPGQAMLEPYISLLGHAFYLIFILGIAGIIYVNTEGRQRIVGIAMWMLPTLTIGGIVLQSGVLLMLGIITGIAVGAIIRKGFWAKEEQ